MREIKKIIVHCTDTPDGVPVTRQQVKEWHLKRGFSDIGYHYLIGIYGEIIEGRPVAEQGAHCEGENHDSVGVCLVGRLDYSAAQITSLMMCLFSLMETFSLKPLDVYCHYEFDDKGKTCPVFSGNMLRCLLSSSPDIYFAMSDKP